MLNVDSSSNNRLDSVEPNNNNTTNTNDNNQETKPKNLNCSAPVSSCSSSACVTGSSSSSSANTSTSSLRADGSSGYCGFDEEDDDSSNATPPTKTSTTTTNTKIKNKITGSNIHQQSNKPKLSKSLSDLVVVSSATSSLCSSMISSGSQADLICNVSNSVGNSASHETTNNTIDNNPPIQCATPIVAVESPGGMALMTTTVTIPTADSNLSLGCSMATIPHMATIHRTAPSAIRIVSPLQAPRPLVPNSPGPACKPSSSITLKASGCHSATLSGRMDDHRYLTYGTSAQLQQEYGKFIPWPTLTEFRLRRKIRRFKRRARKLFSNGNNLLGKSSSSLIHRIQNMRRLMKMAKLAKQDPQQMLNEMLSQYGYVGDPQQQPSLSSGAMSSCTGDDQHQSMVSISRSSSLTSLLNLIEEANKNLLNSFQQEDLDDPLMRTLNTFKMAPKCPPRLKRTMSTINVSSMASSSSSSISTNSLPRDVCNSLQLLNSDMSIGANGHVNGHGAGSHFGINHTNNNRYFQTDPRMHIKDFKTFTKQTTPASKATTAVDNYRIAFVNSEHGKHGATLPASTSTTSTNITPFDALDTISVKSLDSYFGSSLSNTNTFEQYDSSLTNSNKDQQPTRTNSKILCVRSHFQINDGTMYLEDSDWEMCSEISSAEPLSLTIVEQPPPQPQTSNIVTGSLATLPVIKNKHEQPQLPQQNKIEQDDNKQATEKIKQESSAVSVSEIKKIFESPTPSTTTTNSTPTATPTPVSPPPPTNQVVVNKPNQHQKSYPAPPPPTNQHSKTPPQSMQQKQQQQQQKSKNNKPRRMKSRAPPPPTAKQQPQQSATPTTMIEQQQQQQDAADGTELQKQMNDDEQQQQQHKQELQAIIRRQMEAAAAAAAATNSKKVATLPHGGAVLSQSASSIQRRCSVSSSTATLSALSNLKRFKMLNAMKKFKHNHSNNNKSDHKLNNTTGTTNDGGGAGGVQYLIEQFNQNETIQKLLKQQQEQQQQMVPLCLNNGDGAAISVQPHEQQESSLKDIENVVRKIILEQQQLHNRTTQPQASHDLLLMMLLLQLQQQQQQQMQHLKWIQCSNFNAEQQQQQPQQANQPQEQQNQTQQPEQNVEKQELQNILLQIQQLLLEQKQQQQDNSIASDAPEPDVIDNSKQSNPQPDTILSQDKKEEDNLKDNKPTEEPQKLQEQDKSNESDKSSDSQVEQNNSKSIGESVARFVNKILLNNNSINNNDDETSMDDQKELSTPPVDTDHNNNSIQTLENETVCTGPVIIVNSEPTLVKPEPVKSEPESKTEILERAVDCSVQSESGHLHRTVLQLKSNNNAHCQSKFCLIHSIRNQLQKKRNKTRWQRLRKQQQQQQLNHSTLSLATVFEEQTPTTNTANNKQQTSVTLANTSTIEIKAKQQQPTIKPESNIQPIAPSKTGTLRRLLFGGGSSSNAQKNHKKQNKKNKKNEQTEMNKSKTMLNISEPVPLGIESMVGSTVVVGGAGVGRVERRPLQHCTPMEIRKKSTGVFSERPMYRCQSERNFRSIIRLNQTPKDDEEEEEEDDEERVDEDFVDDDEQEQNDYDNYDDEEEEEEDDDDDDSYYFNHNNRYINDTLPTKHRTFRQFGGSQMNLSSTSSMATSMSATSAASFAHRSHDQHNAGFVSRMRLLANKNTPSHHHQHQHHRQNYRENGMLPSTQPYASQQQRYQSMITLNHNRPMVTFTLPRGQPNHHHGQSTMMRHHHDQHDSDDTIQQEHFDDETNDHYDDDDDDQEPIIEDIEDDDDDDVDHFRRRKMIILPQSGQTTTTNTTNSSSNNSSSSGSMIYGYNHLSPNSKLNERYFRIAGQSSSAAARYRY